MNPTRIIAVLGIDGSGKTTVADLLAKQLSADGAVCLISDTLGFYVQGAWKRIPAPPTEVLRHAVGKYAKAARSLQHYKLPKLAELLLRDHVLRLMVKEHQPPFVVADGSPLLNMVAWVVLYKQHRLDPRMCAQTISVLTGRDAQIRSDAPLFRELPELTQLRRLRLTHLVLPDVAFLLDISPEAACRRIEARGRIRQPHEEPGALAKLHAAYEAVCDVIHQQWQIPICRLDAEGQSETIADTALAFVRQTFQPGTRVP
jgi:thymidylate kinase